MLGRKPETFKWIYETGTQYPDGGGNGGQFLFFVVILKIAPIGYRVCDMDGDRHDRNGYFGHSAVSRNHQRPANYLCQSDHHGDHRSEIVIPSLISAFIEKSKDGKNFCSTPAFASSPKAGVLQILIGTAIKDTDNSPAIRNSNVTFIAIAQTFSFLIVLFIYWKSGAHGKQTFRA